MGTDPHSCLLTTVQGLVLRSGGESVRRDLKKPTKSPSQHTPCTGLVLESLQAF